MTAVTPTDYWSAVHAPISGVPSLARLTLLHESGEFHSSPRMHTLQDFSALLWGYSIPNVAVLPLIRGCTVTDRIQWKATIVPFDGSAVLLMAFQAEPDITAPPSAYYMVIPGISAPSVSPQADSPSLDEIYRFRRPSEVRSFLEQHQFLISLLEECHAYIKQFFCAAEVFLEVVTDPEDSDNTQLVAFIATSHSPSEAFNRLKQFDTVWWLQAMDRARERFQVSVEFV